MKKFCDNPECERHRIEFRNFITEQLPTQPTFVSIDQAKAISTDMVIGEQRLISNRHWASFDLKTVLCDVCSGPAKYIFDFVNKSIGWRHMINAPMDGTPVLVDCDGVHYVAYFGDAKSVISKKKRWEADESLHLYYMKFGGLWMTKLPSGKSAMIPVPDCWRPI